MSIKGDLLNIIRQHCKTGEDLPTYQELGDMFGLQRRIISYYLRPDTLGDSLTLKDGVFTWAGVGECVRATKRKNRNKIRKCLKCGKEFESWGPGNRLCDTHRKSDGLPYLF